jgi:cytochrome P450
MPTAVEFDPFSTDYFDYPYDTYRLLREHAPVYFNERYGFYALSRFDDVVHAHRDYATFSSEFGLTVDQLTQHRRDESRSMIMMDPPDHDRMRKLVSRAFTPRAVDGFEPLINDVIHGFLEPLMDRAEFDLLEEFAAPFPVEVISAILGIPEPDRQVFRERTDLLLTRDSEGKMPPEGRQAALDNGIFIYELIQEKRRRPDDKMISVLCDVEVEDDQGGTTKLTDVEIAGFVMLLAAAGSETVTKNVGNGVVEFARHPDQLRLVQDDPSLWPSAIEELLRYLPPSQYQGRYSLAESEWHGQVIPANQPVLLLTGAATRDPDAYDDPDRFDVTRTPQVALYLGHGIHSCLGAALARIESRIALHQIAQRWPNYEVDESGLERVHMSNVAGYHRVPVRVR